MVTPILPSVCRDFVLTDTYGTLNCPAGCANHKTEARRRESQPTADKGYGGERGIRTLDTGVSPYNGLANRRLQPLGHLSGVRIYSLARWNEQRYRVKGRHFRGPALALMPQS